MSMLVMLSGGADSATLLWQFKNLPGLLAVCFMYGQKHKKEVESARWLAIKCGIDLHVVDVGGIKEFLRPNEHNVFPSRNLVFLSMATTIAVSRGLLSVGFAATKDDFDTFPDCRRVFVDAARKAMELASSRPINLIAPYLELTRKQVVEIGREIDVPYDKTWSCYRGGEWPCGLCNPCVSRKECGI